MQVVTGEERHVGAFIRPWVETAVGGNVLPVTVVHAGRSTRPFARANLTTTGQVCSGPAWQHPEIAGEVTFTNRPTSHISTGTVLESPDEIRTSQPQRHAVGVHASKVTIRGGSPSSRVCQFPLGRCAPSRGRTGNGGGGTVKNVRPPRLVYRTAQVGGESRFV